MFYLYVGAEVSLGMWAYTLLTESRGVASEAAGLWTGSYWAMFTVGRILAGLYTKRVGNPQLVMGSLAGALTGALLLWWNPAVWVNLLAVGLIGLAIAPIFPALISDTTRRVGMRFSGQYDRNSDGWRRVGNGDHPGFNRYFSPSGFAGNHSGMFDGAFCSAGWIVLAIVKGKRSLKWTTGLTEWYGRRLRELPLIGTVL